MPIDKALYKRARASTLKAGDSVLIRGRDYRVTNDEVKTEEETGLLLIGIEQGGLKTTLRIGSDEIIDAIQYRPRPTPIGVTMAAQLTAHAAYREACQTQSHLEELKAHIPLDRPDLYKRVQEAEGLAANAINATVDAKTAVDSLLYDLQQKSPG